MSLDIPVYPPDQRDTPVPLSPTDISQFVRLDQCERYLRLRLHERITRSANFMRAYDVAPQAIPPLLTRSGAAFEEAIEETVRQRYPSWKFSDQERKADGRKNDNHPVLERIESLKPGEIVMLFQPRLEAAIGRWQVRGDVDILRLSRGPNGRMQAWIVDMKSTTTSKVEHRVQVAFYREMLESLLTDAGIPIPTIELAILYRGPAAHELPGDEAEARIRQDQIDHANAMFGLDFGQLEHIVEPDPYRETVRDLVTGDHSTANRVLATPFDDLPFHLTLKCDGCAFNELCMKRSDETRDLSLIPHITAQDKEALRRAGINTVEELSALKIEHDRGTEQVDGETRPRIQFVPAEGKEELSRKLATTWPVGPRIDELVFRARRIGNFENRQRRIPGRGYSSLPYTSADQNPNLVRVYLDAQHDHLQDRVYLLGALVVGYEHGENPAWRRRSIVRLSDGPPESADIEQSLFLDWITETLKAVVQVAAPDDEGQPRSPIHLTFANQFAQQTLLEGLARHAEHILGATALYDFVTQIAAFDSPLVSILEAEIARHMNYPMLNQSLASVAGFLKFKWGNYRKIFHERMFDYLGTRQGETDEDEPHYYTRRARFNSQVPLEYAYAAWNHLETPGDETARALEPYRQATPELLAGLQARRLEAMEHIGREFQGNRQTQLSSFTLPDLATFEQRAESLAQALDEFVTIERHVELAEWKRNHLPEPEQRTLSGETLVVQYLESDQSPETIEQNRENTRRYQLRQHYQQLSPEGKITREQAQETTWTNKGIRCRFRLDSSRLPCSLDEVLFLNNLREDESLILFPRYTLDSRLGSGEQRDFTPTVKQLMYGTGARFERIDVEYDANGKAINAWAEVTLTGSRFSSRPDRGFAFGTAPYNELPLAPERLYTLDKDVNSYGGAHAANTTEGLIKGGENVLYGILSGKSSGTTHRPPAWIAAQRQFMDGLVALHDHRLIPPFESSKHEFIGEHASTPLLLVQGPPGTGKTYTTAFALLARLQGALAADRDFRIYVSCKTHQAIDVLLEKIRDVQAQLRDIARTHPDLFHRYFDSRLLDVPIFRYAPKNDMHPDITVIPHKNERPKGTPTAYGTIGSQRWGVFGLTPSASYQIQDGKQNRFKRRFVDCVVLDEASQMSIPEAIMATLPLREDGMILVVGDPRQMAPIVKNDWSNEKRRTFRAFRSYESLFSALIPLNLPIVKFAESFRLHADMAAFLNQEIYRHDGINYHSRRHDVLPRRWIDDDFAAAVLLPEYPLTIIVHDEHRSQKQNRFEQDLMTPVLNVLADPDGFNLQPEDGLGVVVPHRAQRAALQQALDMLSRRDEETGAILVSAVDTVERFQGGERRVILVGTTESDRAYLQVSGDFLLNPQRLTVALSRAQQKLVLVASRSVFELFSADEETFEHAQMWKNLLRKTCTVPLWEGYRHGHAVTVWGNRAS